VDVLVLVIAIARILDPSAQLVLAGACTFVQHVTEAIAIGVGIPQLVLGIFDALVVSVDELIAVIVDLITDFGGIR
jgi:biotin synthase-like enzyme